MPSQPPDTGWDFSSVIDLIDSEVHDIRSPVLSPATRPILSVLQDGGIRLGSFAKLYEDLGLPNEVTALPPLDPDSELSNSDEGLLPSPVFDRVHSPPRNIDHAEDQSSSNAGLSKKQRQRARKQAEKEQKEQIAREQEQEAKSKKQLRALVEAVKTPSKPLHARSKSNAGVKSRPASPIKATEKPVSAAPIAQKEPKTPKLSRPILSKRSSTAQPVTPLLTKPVEPIPVPQIVQVADPVQAYPTLSHTHFTTFGTPASFQYPLAPQYVAQLQTPHVSTPTGRNTLVPRTVRPTTIPRSSQPAVPLQPPATPTPVILAPSSYATSVAQPTTITIRSQVDRHFHLFNKLLHSFPEDQKWIVSPRQLVNENTTSHGLHIFVDASNIMYGLRDILRTHGMQPYEMSFDSLALLMERRRPVAKRVFAGSHREANPLPHVTKLVETSKAVGYESHVKEQVLIVREESDKKKFFNDVKKLGWHKATQLRSGSGSGSDSETGAPAVPKTPSAPKWVEQGVDEILHLKMCQSIIDTEVPSTMVLATGDGAEAEMSDGFLAHVERALKKGWKVELLSWRQQTNGGYKNRKFRTKWAEQFRIIELDDFLEDLIDTP
ncbi:hypothetical protein BKA66DRAFT_146193 [Pyrenochaeta sp. MPI-SDFR-AT-0127]|nr:hypothetical protein BKA66DRAFT_146193 [Pyrenochaeta sp. MPI-SDFR-AT-0127]